MTQASPELNRARGTLLKDLMRSSPKKFQAIVVEDQSSSESEDFDYNEKNAGAKVCGKKSASQQTKKATSKKWRKPSTTRALLFDSSDDDSDSESYTEFTEEQRVCPKCSKVLSSSSELESEYEESETSESSYASSDDESDESYASYTSDESDSDNEYVPQARASSKPGPIFNYFTATGKPKRSPYVEKQMLKRSMEENRRLREPIRSPQVIVSPKRQTPLTRSLFSKHSKIDDIITKRQEKLKAAQEAEKKRIEEEALAKAKAEQVKARKDQVKKILDDLKAKQKNPHRYVAVFYNPKKHSQKYDDSSFDDSETDSESYCSESEDSFDDESSYASSYASKKSYESSDDDELEAELGKLTKIAGRLTMYGKKIKKMTNTSLSPKKRSHK